VDVQIRRNLKRYIMISSVEVNLMGVGCTLNLINLGCGLEDCGYPQPEKLIRIRTLLAGIPVPVQYQILLLASNDQWRKFAWNSGGGGQGADSKGLAEGGV